MFRKDVREWLNDLNFESAMYFAIACECPWDYWRLLYVVLIY